MEFFDLNTLRIVVMLVGLGAFLALWRYLWSPARRSEHAAAALAPFTGDAAARDAGTPPQ
jgi:cbb3-type cytochrome oxidase subunit 3